MASVYFIGTETPANPEKNTVDYSVAYANNKAALEAAKKKAKEKGGDKTVIRPMADDKVGVFVDVGGDLALLLIYQIKTVELLK